MGTAGDLVDESLRCDVSAFRPKTGFQLWLEENRKSITAGQPDLEETDVIREAMGRFRVLSAEERLVPLTFTAFGLKRQRAVPTEALSAAECQKLHFLPQTVEITSCFRLALTPPSIRVQGGD